MDLMYLEGIPVLHVADVATGFGNAEMLTGSMVDDVWEIVVPICAIVHRATGSSCECTARASFLPPLDQMPVFCRYSAASDNRKPPFDRDLKEVQ